MNKQTAKPATSFKRDRSGHPGSDRLLNVNEVAKILGISIRTVWSLRATGALAAYKVGHLTRWRRTDVYRYMNELPRAS
ncbi:MAG: helix-turn-helix domain-containing protein [Planctomycetota bacterium]